MIINRSHGFILFVFSEKLSKNFRIEMLSRGKFILRLSSFQNVFYRCQSQTVGLENHLASVSTTPPKQCYSLLFFDDEVQKLLKSISNIDLKKVFKPRPQGEPLNPPVYKLLNNEQLEALHKEFEEKAEYFMQIPPLVNPTEDDILILDPDTSLDGYDVHHCSHVFTDISFNETNASRAIVVREPNGILRTASKDERFRMNCIYSPTNGREIEMPEMFETEHLLNVIKRKDYEFILDRACAQFEPDDFTYHRVITLTYEAINFCRDFAMLHSTRHFGSLAFYLVSHKKIDQMLDDNIQNERINDAFSLVKLYHKIHPNCKSAELSNGKSDLEILKDFIEHDSNMSSTLNKSLEVYLEAQKNRSNLESGIQQAHGL